MGDFLMFDYRRVIWQSEIRHLQMIAINMFEMMYFPCFLHLLEEFHSVSFVLLGCGSVKEHFWRQQTAVPVDSECVVV
jgi:hypothetical protein